MHYGWQQVMAGLVELLPESSIRLDFAAADWREAVREAGRLLVEEGKAAPEYSEAMVRTVEELGPYIVLAPGLALAHARPEAGARATAFSLIRLARPVDFGHPENDPVDLVVGLAALDHDSHVRAIAEFAQVFGDEAVLEKIRLARSAAAVLAVIREVVHAEE